MSFVRNKLDLKVVFLKKKSNLAKKILMQREWKSSGWTGMGWKWGRRLSSELVSQVLLERGSLLTERKKSSGLSQVLGCH